MSHQPPQKQPGAEPCPYCGGMFSRCYGSSKKHRRTCAPKSLEELRGKISFAHWSCHEVEGTVWVFDHIGNVIAFVQPEDSRPLRPWGESVYAYALHLAREASEQT